MSLIYFVHASDAPQHINKFQNICEKLLEESRISGYNAVEASDFTKIINRANPEDLVVALLTQAFESLKPEVEESLNEIQNTGAKVAEIILDNVPYDKRFLTFPTDLKPIRTRDDMDAAWETIAGQLRDIFPMHKPEPEAVAVDWKKLALYLVPALLIILAVFYFARGFNGDSQVRADFEMDRTTCTAPCEVSLKNISKSAESFTWDFGDQSGTSTTEHPVHRYEKPGRFIVKLTVVNGGSTSSKTSEITVENREQPATVDRFELPIRDVVTIQGRGTVVTGVITGGIINNGDKVLISGNGTLLSTVVTGIEISRSMVESAKKGEEVGILLRGISRDQVKRGMILSAPGEQILSIVLEEAGDQKVQVIKIVRMISGLGLKESKDLVESAPTRIWKGTSRGEAQKIMEEFTKVGAVVRMQ